MSHDNLNKCLKENPKILDLYYEYKDIFIKKAIRFLKDEKIYNETIYLNNLKDFKNGLSKNPPHILFEFFRYNIVSKPLYDKFSLYMSEEIILIILKKC